MKTKKILLVPFGGAGIVLSMASAAFACTVFLGTLTLTGSTSGGVTSTGNRTGMSSTLSGTQAYSGTTGTVIVSTGASATSPGNKLPYLDSSGKIKTYYLRFFNGAAYYGFNSNWLRDCMAGSNGTLMSEVTLNSGGGIATLKPGSSGSTLSAGKVTVKLTKDFFGNTLINTANTGAQESAFCISDPVAVYANQAPLTII